MSCIITYKGKKYSEEQFKEYFINNKQEFATSIAKNKDVIDSFKRKMEGIDFVFSQSPEIASIGSKAQYLQYLSTIFKTSKVKDIVYHGTNLNFDKFDKNKIGGNTAVKGERPSFSFSNNKQQAEAYSSSITVGQNTNELAEIWFEENQHIFKNGDITTRVIDENNVIEHYKKELENSKEMISPIKEIDPITNKYKLVPVNNENLKQLAEIKTKEWQQEYITLLTGGARVMSVILDIKTPKIVDFKGEKKSTKFKEEQLSTKGDAFIAKNIDDWGKGDVIQVFEPEQIHILGSKQDIQGFKEFVNKSNVQYQKVEDSIYKPHSEQDIQESLGSSIKIPTSKVGTKIFNDIFNGKAKSTNSQSILEKLFANKYISPELSSLAQLLNRLNVPIKFVPSLKQFTRNSSTVIPMMHIMNETLSVNEIHIAEDTFDEYESEDEFTRIFLHEMLHAHLNSTLLSPQTEMDKKFSRRITQLFKQAIHELGRDSKFYGVKNEVEFVAEIMTNGEFQQALSKTKTNIFQRFLNFVFDLLGIDAQFGKSITQSAVDEILMKLPKIGSLKSDASAASPYMMNGKRVSKTEFLDKLKQTLKLQKVVYGDRKKSIKLIERIEVAEELLKKGNEAAFIAALVSDAEHFIVEMERQYEQLRGLFNKVNPTDEEIRKVLTLLNEFKSLASAYSILDDIERFLSEEGLSLTRVSNLVNKQEKPYLDYLIGLSAKRDKLLSNYMNHAVHMLAEWIYPHADLVNQKLVQSGEDAKHLLTKDLIVEMLTEAPKDIGTVNAALGAVINSADPINALVAKIVKFQLEKARLMDLNTRNLLMEEYVKKSGSKDNVASFNKDYIQEITLPNGTKVLAIPQEVNDHEFFSAREKFFKDLEASNIVKGTVKYAKAVKQWFSDNTQLRPDYKEYIENLKTKLTTDEFRAFILKNTREVNLYYESPPTEMVYSDNMSGQARVYSGVFLVPNKIKYGNKKFSKLMQDPYFAKLHQVYTEANNKLPRTRRLRYGILPQFQKTTLDGAIEHGIDLDSHFARIKEFWKSRGTREGIDEARYGTETYQTLSGEVLKFLPIYGTKLLEDQKEVSKDLLSSVLLFSQMANRFDTSYEILPHINTLQTVVFGSPMIAGSGRKVAETVPGSVDKVINKITKVVKKKEQDNVNRRLKHFLDSIFWGQENLKIEMKIPGIGIVNVDKFFDKLGMLNALSTMTLNIVGSIDNITIGNLNNVIEAVTKKHGLKNLARAKAEFGKLLLNGDILGDVGKTYNKSKFGQLVDLYDSIQGEFKDNFGRKVSGSRFKNLFGTSAAFVLNNIGEYEIQGTAFLAKLLETTVKDSKGNDISLYDAYEVVNSKLKLKDGVQWSEMQRFTFMNELHGMNKDLQGNYNHFDKSVWQRYALGRLALMFRKYVYTGFSRRWGTEQVDYEQGIVKEGYYRTFLGKLYTEAKDGHYTTLVDWSRLSPKERAAFTKTLVELGLFLATAALFGWLDDDEEKTKSEQLTLLLLRRTMANLVFFTGLNPRDTVKLMATPAVSLDYYSRVMDLFYHVIFEWDEADLYYKRDSGLNKKGDRKSMGKLRRILPGVRGLDNFFAPEQQLQVFK